MWSSVRKLFGNEKERSKGLEQVGCLPDPDGWGVGDVDSCSADHAPTIETGNVYLAPHTIPVESSSRNDQFRSIDTVMADNSIDNKSVDMPHVPTMETGNKYVAPCMSPVESSCGNDPSRSVDTVMSLKSIDSQSVDMSYVDCISNCALLITLLMKTLRPNHFPVTKETIDMFSKLDELNEVLSLWRNEYLSHLFKNICQVSEDPGQNTTSSFCALCSKWCNSHEELTHHVRSSLEHRCRAQRKTEEGKRASEDSIKSDSMCSLQQDLTKEQVYPELKDYKSSKIEVVVDECSESSSEFKSKSTQNSISEIITNQVEVKHYGKVIAQSKGKRKRVRNADASKYNTSVAMKGNRVSEPVYKQPITMLSAQDEPFIGVGLDGQSSKNNGPVQESQNLSALQLSGTRPGLLSKDADFDCVETPALTIGNSAKGSLQEEYNQILAEGGVCVEAVCDQCKATFPIFNGDIELSFDMHVQNDIQHDFATALPIERNAQHVAETLKTSVSVKTHTRSMQPSKQVSLTNSKKCEKSNVQGKDNESMVSFYCFNCNSILKMSLASKKIHLKAHKKQSSSKSVFSQASPSPSSPMSNSNSQVKHPDNTNKAVKALKETPSKKLFYCSICDKQLPKQCEKTHVYGKSHKRVLMLQYGEAHKEALLPQNQFYCDVCDRVMASVSKTEHISGKAHKTKLLSKDKIVLL